MAKRKKMYDDILSRMGADPSVPIPHGIAPPNARGLVASDAQMMGGPGRPSSPRDAARMDRLRDLHSNVMTGNYGHSADLAAGQATINEIKAREQAEKERMDLEYKQGQKRGLLRLPDHQLADYVEVKDPRGKTDFRHKDSPEGRGERGYTVVGTAKDENMAFSTTQDPVVGGQPDGERMVGAAAARFPPRPNAAAPPQVQHNTEQAEQNHTAAQEASGTGRGLVVDPDSPSNEPDDPNWMSHPETRIKYYPREGLKLTDEHFMPGHSPYRNSSAQPAPRVIGLTADGNFVLESGYEMRPGLAIHPQTNLPYDRNNPGRGIGVPGPRKPRGSGPGVWVNPDTSYMPTLHPAYRDDSIAGKEGAPGWISPEGVYTKENAPEDVQKAVEAQQEGELSAPSRPGYGYAPDAPPGETFATPYGPNRVMPPEEFDPANPLELTPGQLEGINPPMGWAEDTTSGQAQRRQRRDDRSPREMVEGELEGATAPDIRPDPSQHLGILQRIKAKRAANRAARQQGR
jgi:hypothetical protein